MARSGDLYDVLGVAKDASPQDIKRAFRTKARELHPDVAGNDAAKAEAFKRVREAYEVLSDPEARARYDRRGQPRSGGPFYGSMWNRGNVNVGSAPSGPSTAQTRAAGNDLDLEDIFNDFSGVGDFGFTGSTRSGGSGRFKGTSGGGFSGARPGGGGPGPARPGGGGAQARAGSEAHGRAGAGRADGGGTVGGFGGGHARGPADGRPGDSGHARPGGSATGGHGPSPSWGGPNPDASASKRNGRRTTEVGRDIPVQVDVPQHVAAVGGSVTVTYVRLRRADDGHTLYRYDELYDLKVPPGTRHGETLRVAKLGDAGLEGGPYGDLVVDVRVVPLGARDEPRGGAWDPEVEGRRTDRAWGEPEADVRGGSSRVGGSAAATPPPGGRAPLDPPPGDEPGLGAGPGAASGPDREVGGARFEEAFFGGEAGWPGDGRSRRRPPEGAKASAWSPSGWSRADDGMGSAAGGGAAGGARRDSRRMRMPGHEPATTADGALRVDISVVTALLGGRVAVPTPSGPVRVNVPPGTSSGTRMRLRGRGPAGPDGAATDLVAELRIVVPKELDAASRELIERFARLNPEQD